MTTQPNKPEPSAQDELRAALEGAARKAGYNLTRCYDANDEYAFPAAAGAWFGFQAGAHWQASRVAPVVQAHPTDDDLLDKTMRDRDHYHEMADKLAAAIAEHFDGDIGEHSNMNCPWTKAIDLADSAACQFAIAPSEPRYAQMDVSECWRKDLESIYKAMNYMGDVLNGMDAVEDEDLIATVDGFDAIRRLLAAQIAPQADDNGRMPGAFTSAEALFEAMGLGDQPQAVPLHERDFEYAKNTVPGIKAVLYTDDINGTQVLRDDLWLATTEQLNSLAKIGDGAPQAVAAPDREDSEWRCFHCSEKFTDEVQARLHFGKTEHSTPACQYDVAMLREIEETQRRHAEDDTELDRQIYRMQSQHTVELRRSEEQGYERGLKDASYTNVRNAVLEEAALVCDQQSTEPECPERAAYCAEAIRALKQAPQPIAAPAAEVCRTCHGSGQMCIGTSGLDSDGNAPVLEPCGECGYDTKSAAFDAARVRRVAALVGLMTAIPDTDECLLGCIGSIMGMVASKIEALKAAASQQPVPALSASISDDPHFPEVLSEFLQDIDAKPFALGLTRYIDAWAAQQHEAGRKECRAEIYASLNGVEIQANSAQLVQQRATLSDKQISDVWNSLPGIEIHNRAARDGVDTNYALRIAFARAILAARSAA